MGSAQSKKSRKLLEAQHQQLLLLQQQQQQQQLRQHQQDFYHQSSRPASVRNWIEEGAMFAAASQKPYQSSKLTQLPTSRQPAASKQQLISSTGRPSSTSTTTTKQLLLSQQQPMAKPQPIPSQLHSQLHSQQLYAQPQRLLQTGPASFASKRKKRNTTSSLHQANATGARQDIRRRQLQQPPPLSRHPSYHVTQILQSLEDISCRLTLCHEPIHGHHQQQQPLEEADIDNGLQDHQDDDDSDEEDDELLLQPPLPPEFQQDSTGTTATQGSTLTLAQLHHGQHQSRISQAPPQPLIMASHHHRGQQQQQHEHRGLGYTADERRKLRLEGHLPVAHQDQELQIRAVINYLDKCAPDDLTRYVYLRQLKDFNEPLFYATLSRHVQQLMPIVYTPTVGLACQKFSHIFMRPRGLYINPSEVSGRGVGQVLANHEEPDVRVIVVTDGERILGLGDLGANGMGISIGKLSLYTALAGIPPRHVLPICIDVGTNNQSLLDDPLYIGLRQRRIRGEKYTQLLDQFMEAVVERWGRTCLIQFEDFANSTAFNLLNRYRNSYCTFNDDIQGTASVCLSGLISACRLSNKSISSSNFLFYGAGEANLGTAHLLLMAMAEDGASAKEARSRIWLVDSRGLVVEGREGLSEQKLEFAQKAPQISSLEDIIEHVKPLAIIGASAQAGSFSEQVCRKMATINERPIIFALSNPTSKAECTAQQAYEWTQGRCIFASGSPFEPVKYGDKTYQTGQGNNAYIFPAVGLACIATHLHTIPEDTFLVAARALSDQLTKADTDTGLIYPELTRIKEVTLKIAARVVEHFYSERLATYLPEPLDKIAFLRSLQYDFTYKPLDNL